ncbi:MAG TPA: hypothetical protein VK491_07680 [Gemmatimonadaceae bacterium]|nr:hypothetical protein [Gemmatimonadaceae bacterium]
MIFAAAFFATSTLLSGLAGSQEPGKKLATVPPDTGKTLAAVPGTEKKLAVSPAFFETPDPIDVTLTANIGKLRGDKRTDPPWRPATMSYKGTDGSALTVPIQARTRGIWRLRMCDFPPLRLNFSGEKSKGSIFHKLDKPKLVSYCQDNDLYEQYIL